LFGYKTPTHATLNVKLFYRDPQKAPMVAKTRRLSHYAFKLSKNVSCIPTKNGMDRHIDRWIDGYVNKKPHRNAFYSRMLIFITEESISTKFCTSIPWADRVIYLNRHPNWLRFWDDGGAKFGLSY